MTTPPITREERVEYFRDSVPERFRTKTYADELAQMVSAYEAALAATEKENTMLREASGLTARETLLLIEQAMEFEVPPVVAKLLRKARLNLLTVLVRFTEPMQEKGTKE